MVAAKVKQGREKQVKDVISGKALQRLAKHAKKRSFRAHEAEPRKAYKHVPFPAQKKGNVTFLIETYNKNTMVCAKANRGSKK